MTNQLQRIIAPGQGLMEPAMIAPLTNQLHRIIAPGQGLMEPAMIAPSGMQTMNNARNSGDGRGGSIVNSDAAQNPDSTVVPISTTNHYENSGVGNDIFEGNQMTSGLINAVNMNNGQNEHIATMPIDTQSAMNEVTIVPLSLTSANKGLGLKGNNGKSVDNNMGINNIVGKKIMGCKVILQQAVGAPKEADKSAFGKSSSTSSRPDTRYSGPYPEAQSRGAEGKGAASTDDTFYEYRNAKGELVHEYRDGVYVVPQGANEYRKVAVTVKGDGKKSKTVKSAWKGWSKGRHEGEGGRGSKVRRGNPY